MVVTIREYNQCMGNCIRAEQKKEVDVLTLNFGNSKEGKKNKRTSKFKDKQVYKHTFTRQY